jgi:hypothetical protein
MPSPSPEQLREKTQVLKKRLKEKAASLEGPKRRALEKRIRRLQRKRRKIETVRARAAGKPKEEKKEG